MQTVAQNAKKLGVDIDAGMAEKFEKYSEILIKWASGINLTSVTDHASIAVTHFLDSVTAVRWIEPGSSVVDIGAGAGFPGIPIKICVPSINLTLTDSREKKVFFMREVIRKLRLKNVRAVKARAGSEDEKIGGGFDFAVSRATGAIPEIARVALPLVKEGGFVLIMKGKNGAREWEQSKRQMSGAAALHSAQQFSLPPNGESRFILTLRKK